MRFVCRKKLAMQNNNINQPEYCQSISIGGQAVMEGVMMNGIHHYAVACRTAKGEILSEIFERGSLTEKYKFLNIPIVRGVIKFAESLVIGFKTTDYAAEIYAADVDDDEAKNADGAGDSVGVHDAEGAGDSKDTETSKKAPKEKNFLEKFWEEKQESILTALAFGLAIILALGLFVALPVALSRLVYNHLVQSTVLLGVMEGVIRMLIFLLYLYLISKIKDIRRTFEYHGAEHKCIHCFEAGLPFTVENVRKQTRFHKRCGTSFLFIIMIVSILVFAFIRITNPVARFFTHLALIPLIAGLSYEVLKLSARSDSALVNALVAPGLWIQRVTTREPDDEEIEVGIASVKKLFEAEHPELLYLFEEPSDDLS